MKKIIAIITAALMLPLYSVSASEPQRGGSVTVIVLTEGETILSGCSEKMDISLYSKTDEAARIEENAEHIQAEVMSEINDGIDSEAKIGYTYSYAINGFSMEAYEEDIEKIASLPNVKSVQKARVYEPYEDIYAADDAYTGVSGKIMNAAYMHENGITGKGTVIAVIDDGFDTSHEIFQGAVDSPRLSKQDIAALIESSNLTANENGGVVTPNRVYRSEKIPYAYNYYTKDSDTYNASSSHGTHVAGIAAGNNGTDTSGNKFLGAAPDAQLLLMGCTLLSEDAVLAAIEDSVKLGADVINASWGQDYDDTYENEDYALNDAISSVISAGIFFSAAAGNMGRGYLNKQITTSYIDYGSSGSPAIVSGVTSVASAVNPFSMGNLQNLPSPSAYINMSSTSGWGIGTSLELKPEITVPGANIYSSVNEGAYGYKSGTSMAAPNFSGAAALMRQYMSDNPERYGETETTKQFTESLLMSSAETLMQDKTNKIPYSPRQQGAGMLNLKGAALTPVVLEGDGGKAKLNLKNVTENLQLKFKARNFTDADAVYDNVSMTVITDSSNNGVIGNMKTLTFTSDLPETLTVAAGEEKEITVNVSLDKSELQKNGYSFTNGFYIDGYIFLAASGDTLPALSIPFTGFYGDWTRAETLDKPYYSGDSQLGKTYIAAWSQIKSGRTAVMMSGDRAMYILGQNTLTADTDRDYEGEKYAGISPNGDGEADIPTAIFTPLRRTGKTTYTITDTKGNTRVEKTDISSSTGKPYYAPKFTPSYLNFDSGEINSLEDGFYRIDITTDFYGVEEQEETVTMWFYVDREKPVITKMETREENGSVYLDIAASDNNYLMGFTVSGTKDNEPFYTASPVKGLGEASASIDITGVQLSTLDIRAYDYAHNFAERTNKGLNVTRISAVHGTGGQSILLSFNNSAGSEIDATVIYALYSGGVLKALKAEDAVITEGASLRTAQLAETAYDNMKVFVWDSAKGMRALYDTFEFKND